MPLFVWEHPFFCVLYVGKNLCFCAFCCGNDRYVTSVFAAYLELYSSIYQGVESVVATHADVLARVEFCTSLTNDDVACFAGLTTEYLNA